MYKPGIINQSLPFVGEYRFNRKFPYLVSAIYRCIPY